MSDHENDDNDSRTLDSRGSENESSRGGGLGGSKNGAGGGGGNGGVGPNNTNGTNGGTGNDSTHSSMVLDLTELSTPNSKNKPEKQPYNSNLTNSNSVLELNGSASIGRGGAGMGGIVVVPDRGERGERGERGSTGSTGSAGGASRIPTLLGSGSIRQSRGSEIMSGNSDKKEILDKKDPSSSSIATLTIPPTLTFTNGQSSIHQSPPALPTVTDVFGATHRYTPSGHMLPSLIESRDEGGVINYDDGTQSPSLELNTLGSSAPGSSPPQSLNPFHSPQHSPRAGSSPGHSPLTNGHHHHHTQSLSPPRSHFVVDVEMANRNPAIAAVEQYPLILKHHNEEHIALVARLVGIFDRALEQVTKLLTFDTLPRFLRSPEFLEFCETFNEAHQNQAPPNSKRQPSTPKGSQALNDQTHPEPIADGLGGKGNADGVGSNGDPDGPKPKRADSRSNLSISVLG